VKFEQNKVLRELDRLNGEANELYREIAAERGLSDSAYAVLQAVLVLGGGCTQADICRYSCLNKQTLNSSVKKLKADGIISMRAGSGRELKIYLTPAGEEIVREKILPVENAENEIFEEMTSAEQREILRLMDKYLTSLREKLSKL